MIGSRGDWLSRRPRLTPGCSARRMDIEYVILTQKYFRIEKFKFKKRAIFYVF
jgi:hypothetical protein